MKKLFLLFIPLLFISCDNLTNDSTAEEIKKLKEEIDALKTELEKQDEPVEEKPITISDIENLENKLKEIDTLKQLLEEIQTEDSDEEIASLKAEIESIKADIESLEAELLVLKEKLKKEAEEPCETEEQTSNESNSEETQKETSSEEPTEQTTEEQPSAENQEQTENNEESTDEQTVIERPSPVRAEAGTVITGFNFSEIVDIDSQNKQWYCADYGYGIFSTAYGGFAGGQEKFYNNNVNNSDFTISQIPSLGNSKYELKITYMVTRDLETSLEINLLNSNYETIATHEASLITTDKQKCILSYVYTNDIDNVDDDVTEIRIYSKFNKLQNYSIRIYDIKITVIE